MINLGVCNEKLYERTIGIIVEITGVEKQFAETCLLKSIYQSDTIVESEDINQR